MYKTRHMCGLVGKRQCRLTRSANDGEELAWLDSTRHRVQYYLGLFGFCTSPAASLPDGDSLDDNVFECKLDLLLGRWFEDHLGAHIGQRLVVAAV